MLAREPERQTVALSVIESVRAGMRWGPEPPLYGWWDGHAECGFGAVIVTPPFPLLLAAVPDAALDDLVAQLTARGVRLVGVNGTTQSAAAFADRWARHAAVSTDTFMEQRLYRLEDPDALEVSTSGRARRASVSDADLLVRWYTAFSDEAAPGQGHPDSAIVVRHRVTAGLLWLWEDDGGSPVALAGRNPTAAGVARVGPVYTPPQHRRRGYGAAVTAACTRDALAEGASGVVLYTDLANATTNAIYQQIGYRPVEDRVILRFSAPGRT